MKATIEIPDDLYRRVKAKSALQGRPIRAVAMELFQRWLDEDTLAAGQAPERTPEEWLEDWLRLGAELSRNAPPGPTATEILEADRNRLERR
jgi:hypothetical protein